MSFDFDLWKATITESQGRSDSKKLLQATGLVETYEIDHSLLQLIQEIQDDIDGIGEFSSPRSNRPELMFTSDEIAADPILVGMVRDKLALTRENYIERCYGDLPESWDAELESKLPEKLQDWSSFGL